MSEYPVIKRNRYFDERVDSNTGYPPHTSQDHASDLESYHLPIQRVRSEMFDPGVVRGLEVTGKIGDTKVTIDAGIALDVQGQVIVLSSKGHGDIRNSKEERPNEQWVPVDLPLSKPGSFYLTIEFSEVLRADAGCGGQLEQVPWLRLQSAEDSAMTQAVVNGTIIVLAIVGVDEQGKLQDLASKRNGIGLRIGRLDIGGMKTETVTKSGKDDLVMPLGYFGAGTSYELNVHVAGNCAEVGGIYHIVGDSGRLPTVNLRSECSIQERLKFYGKMDGQANYWLTATWENQSDGKNQENWVFVRITGMDFDTSKSTAFDKDFKKLSSSLAINSSLGQVGIGTTPHDRYRLTIGAESGHMQLRREATKIVDGKEVVMTGGRQVFLELYQNDQGPAKVPETYPTIRFHHGHRFWHRIEVRPDGFHFKQGEPTIKSGEPEKDDYEPIHAGEIVASRMIEIAGCSDVAKGITPKLEPDVPPEGPKTNRLTNGGPTFRNSGDANDSGSYWETDIFPSSITIDLTGKDDVVRWQIAYITFGTHWRTHERFTPKAYRIEYRLIDREEWKPVVEVDDNHSASVIHAVNIEKARYLRFIVKSPQDGLNKVHISGLQVLANASGALGGRDPWASGLDGNVTLATTGKVGIGTPTPQGTLHVNAKSGIPLIILENCPAETTADPHALGAYWNEHKELDKPGTLLILGYTSSGKGILFTWRHDKEAYYCVLSGMPIPY